MTETPRSQRCPTLGGTHRVVGDHQQRISIPMPQTLEQLRSYAERHFGAHSGLYHHGKWKVHKGHHVDALGHGDVIVVTRDPPNNGPPPITTHQADYVKPPLDLNRQLGPLRVRPHSTGKFDGRTAYDRDFVQHPLEATRGFKPDRPWKPSPELTGESSYKSHFLPPTQEGRLFSPRPAAQDQRPSLPFEGASSYQREYVMHSARPSTSAKPQERELPPARFDGASTYNDHFVEHPMDRSKLYKPEAVAPEATPFEATTEYNRRYLKHERPHVPMVHLQPSIGLVRRSSRADDGSGLGRSDCESEATGPASVRGVVVKS